MRYAEADGVTNLNKSASGDDRQKPMSAVWAFQTLIMQPGDLAVATAVTALVLR